MSGSDHHRGIEQFEAQLRSWGGRPPTLAPAVAANRVMGQLPERGAALPWLRLAAVAAMLALLTVTAWLAAPSRPEAPAVAALGSDQVVEFWLDSDTAVYFVLPQFGEGKGETS